MLALAIRLASGRGQVCAKILIQFRVKSKPQSPQNCMLDGQNMCDIRSEKPPKSLVVANLKCLLYGATHRRGRFS